MKLLTQLTLLTLSPLLAPTYEKYHVTSETIDTSDTTDLFSNDSTQGSTNYQAPGRGKAGQAPPWEVAPDRWWNQHANRTCPSPVILLYCTRQLQSQRGIHKNG